MWCAVQAKESAAEKRQAEKREAEKLQEEARAAERAKQATHQEDLIQQHSLLARRDSGSAGMFGVDMSDVAADAGAAPIPFLHP